jgi:hypothetical protein
LVNCLGGENRAFRRRCSRVRHIDRPRQMFFAALTAILAKIGVEPILAKVDGTDADAASQQLGKIPVGAC